MSSINHDKNMAFRYMKDMELIDEKQFNDIMALVRGEKKTIKVGVVNGMIFEGECSKEIIASCKKKGVQLNEV